MLTEAPSPDVLKSHMGSSTMMAWNTICAFIDQNYDMEPSWNYGGKHGKYVLRFKKMAKPFAPYMSGTISLAVG